MKERISYTVIEPPKRFPLHLIYNSNISADEAVNKANVLASEDSIPDMARSLREIMLNALKKVKNFHDHQVLKM